MPKIEVSPQEEQAIKLILNRRYDDGVDEFERISFDDNGDIVGIGLDKNGTKVRRVVFKITDENISFNYLPPNANFAELDWSRDDWGYLSFAEPEITDPVDFITEKAIAQTKDALDDWTKPIYSLVEKISKSSKPDSEKYAELTDSIVDLYPKLDSGNFAEVLGQAMTLLDSYGRYQVVEGEPEFEEVADFGSKAFRKKSTCTQGYSCGYSCISKAKNCQQVLPGQAKTYMDWLERQISGLGSEKLSPSHMDDAKKAGLIEDETTEIVAPTYKDFIDSGNKLIPQSVKDAADRVSAAEQKIKDAETMPLSPELQEVDARVKQLQRQSDGLDLELYELHDDHLAGKIPYTDYIARADTLNLRLSAIIQERESLHSQLPSYQAKQEFKVARRALNSELENFRQQLQSTSSLSRADAIKQAAKVKILPAAKKMIGDDPVSTLADFYQLTNGKGSASLARIEGRSGTRAYASKAEKKVVLGSKSQTTLYHEIGHHIEFENIVIGEASNEWVKSRASGEPQRLSVLTSNTKYKADEQAYPDQFTNPYVGKTYGNSYISEVISMGVQHFTDGQSMADLYLSDKEHFAFTLGAVRS